MGTRWIYRAVEEHIDSGTFSRASFPHTHLSKRVRFTLREGRDFAKIYSVSCISLSSLHGQSSESINSAVKGVASLDAEIRGTIPYLVSADSSSPQETKSVDEERNEAVRKFLQLQNQTQADN